MSDRPPAYAITVKKRRGGSEPYICNPEFRKQALALATTGMSRRGVALRLGVSLDTIAEYLSRGRAHPSEEPWGSFAAEYLQAERGLEEAATTTIGLWLSHLRVTAETTPEKITGYHIDSLLKVLQSRFSRDHGTHPHREPEQDPSGDAWLEKAGITHAQLVHMLKDPPEPVRLALAEAGYPAPAVVVEAEEGQ